MLSGDREYIESMLKEGKTIEVHRKEIIILTKDYPGKKIVLQLLEYKIDAAQAAELFDQERLEPIG